MTSIAIISQHPLRAPTISTVATTTATSTHGGANVGVGHNVDLELTLCSLERRRACGSSKEGSWNWTNFHFVMCIGVVGFLVFWFVLLCRMYLPLEYQFWAKPKPWVSHFCLLPFITHELFYSWIWAVGVNAINLSLISSSFTGLNIFQRLLQWDLFLIVYFHSIAAP